MRRKFGSPIIGDDAQAGERDVVLMTETSSDRAFHIHGERFVLPSQALFLLGIANQFRHGEQPASGNGKAVRGSRKNRWPALALWLDNLGCQHEIADALLWLKRSRKSDGYQQTGAIRHTVEARFIQTPAQGRFHRPFANAGFHEKKGVRNLFLRKWFRTPFSAELSATRCAGETLANRIGTPKVHRLAAHGKDETGSRQEVCGRHQEICHISILRLSPMRLLTPSAAEGS